MINLFKRHKKKEQKEIIISQETVIFPEKLDIYHEQSTEKVHKVPKYTTTELKNLIITNYQKAEKRLEKLIKDYYILKLFSRAATRSGRFNEKMLHLDKQLNYTKRLNEEIKRKMDIVKYMQDVTNEELMEIYDKVEQFLDQIQQTQLEADDINLKHYNKIKLASAGIIINKNNFELEKFNREVNEFIYQYKSLQEAAEHVYYYSGDLIVQTVNSLVQSIKLAKNSDHIYNYDYNYFLESSTVITLSLPQWIELFNKIRYVLRTVSDVNVINYVDFKNYYQKLEVRYFILMLYMESKSKYNSEGKITDFNI